MSAATLLITTQQGLGDCIMARPFVRARAAVEPVVVRTPWPELFEDLPGVAGFARPERMHLRTQSKNVRRQPASRWVRALPSRNVRLRYAPGGNIYEQLNRCLPLPAATQIELDLPEISMGHGADRPIALVRPATLRREWLNQARNPDPRYVAAAAGTLQRRGYHVMSVADLEDGVEWIEGEPPPADVTLHDGQLNVRQLLALVRDAAIVVGPVGWILPACLATRTPLILIAGGQGGFNAPALLLHDDLERDHVRWLLPDQYCRCTDPRHACPKTISDFDDCFEAALDALRPAEVAP